ELGLEYERLDYGHVHGGTDTPEYRAMNPRGLVPTLKDGDLVIWESCAILRYLASRYGDGGAFWPSDPEDRATVDMWAEWAKVDYTPSLTMPIFWVRVRTAAKDRDEAALAAAIERFEGKLDLIEAQLGDRDYLVGDAFTAADIVVGHVLFRWFDMDIPRRPRPVIEAYYQRLTERPAYRAHVMVDYSILRVEGA
ncbi:MAG: glutathione S-transferase family protein, partial [Pseudomonadota bacterium]